MRLLSKVKTKLSYEIKPKVDLSCVPISLKALKENNWIIIFFLENIRDTYLKQDT